MSTLCAVYGSLRTGFHNNRCLGESRLVGTGTAAGFDLFPYAGTSFPACAKGDGDLVVEVFEVDENILRRLDRLEGYPHFYNRCETSVVLEDGTEVEAWVYFLGHREASQDDDLSAIPSGDWKAYTDERRDYRREA